MIKLLLYFLLAVAEPYPTLTLSFICIDAHEMSLLEQFDICDAFNLWFYNLPVDVRLTESVNSLKWVLKTGPGSHSHFSSLTDRMRRTNLLSLFSLRAVLSTVADHQVNDHDMLLVGVFQAGAQDNPRLAQCLKDAHQFLTITQVPAATCYLKISLSKMFNCNTIKTV